jgi:hypothetical protein
MMSELPAIIRVVLDRLALVPSRWQDITRLRGDAFVRTTYRIDLADGTTIKARHFQDAGHAARLFAARRRVPREFVPAFHLDGGVLLERWIPGNTLESAPPASHVEAAGVLLASLHLTTPRGLLPAATPSWIDRANTDLRLLVEAGALDGDTAARARALLVRLNPATGETVIGHYDFCGENMAIDGRGVLHVFDNERIGPGPLAYDLARTRYRWALSPDDWQQFLAAYTRVLASDAVETAARFWDVVVSIQSAAIRLHGVGLPLATPIAALRRALSGAPS